ncbi:hypothetical protein ES708_10106 [subsurface metagenome]
MGKKLEQNEKRYAIKLAEIKAKAQEKINSQARILATAGNEIEKAKEEVKRLAKAKARTDELNERLLEKCAISEMEADTEQLLLSN